MIVGKLLALATLTFACSSPDDCALNGMCVDSKCQCLSGWAGKACDTLNASTPSPGYHNQTRASWGGNIVFANNTYHLIMAQVVGDHCGLEHYGSNSAIARAEASDPAGPFQFKEYVVTPFAHNPTIQALPNNTGYVIFFIGSSGGTPVNCSAPPSSSSNSAPVAGSIHAVYAPSVYGPWSAPHQIAFEDAPNTKWAGGGYNPSPSIGPDGTVTLAVHRTFSPNPGKELIGIARASTWRGPYTMLTPEPVEPEKFYCVAGNAEDPYLWEDSRGYHVMWHGMCPSGVDQAHYAHSKDAVTWTVSPRQTYSYDGLARVERPQLFFQHGREKGPTQLINGACHGGSAQGIYDCLELPSGSLVMTYTLIRNLQS
jgi:hypothetical protein